MIGGKVSYGTVPKELLKVDPAECAARLGMPIGELPELYDLCYAELMDAVSCKYAFVKCGISYDGGIIDMGFQRIESRGLFANLHGCREAFVFAVTLGIGVDRLLSRYALTSGAKSFTADAIASALAESACDIAEDKIKAGCVCRPRFSPGYADLPLELQPGILELLQARRLLGITLDGALLMTPRKSITAIMGIVDND